MKTSEASAMAIDDPRVLHESVVDFDAAWPQTRTALGRYLAARGVQPSDADDIAQEVAVRALADVSRFSSGEHFLRWCLRVAANLHIDATRSQRRISSVPAPETPDLRDTATAVEQRLMLERLVAEVAELPAGDRALLFDPEPPASRKEAVRLAVRRHRIRARLAAGFESVLGAGLVLRRMMRHVVSSSNVTLAAVPVLAAATVLGLVTDPAGGGARSEQLHTVVLHAAVSESGRPSVARPSGPFERRTAAAAPVAPKITAGSSGRTAPQTILAVHAGATPIAVTTDQRPPDTPLVCLFGVVNSCVPRPQPVPGQPALPAPASGVFTPG